MTEEARFRIGDIQYVVTKTENRGYCLTVSKDGKVIATLREKQGFVIEELLRGKKKRNNDDEEELRLYARKLEIYREHERKVLLDRMEILKEKEPEIYGLKVREGEKAKNWDPANWWKGDED